MSKKTNEKTGKFWFECDVCKGRIKRGQIACIKCGIIDSDAHKEARDLEDMKPKDRMKRMTKGFTQEFDKNMLGLALHILESRENVLITELIELFLEEGLFQDMEVAWFDEKLDKKIFASWAVKYVIKLAKAWHKNKEVFIGARQIKGHPYEIYLPENSNKLMDDLKVRSSVTSDLGKVLMLFGKYRGLPIQTMYDTEPSYVVWLYEKANLRDGILKDAITYFYNKIKGDEMGGEAKINS